MIALLEPQSRFAPAYPQIRSTRYPSLDVWRGLACLLIVVMHSTFPAQVGDVAFQKLQHPTAARIVFLIRQMWIGVPMFFVISGYCISATADSSRRKARATSHYFKRRIRRIFPPYWVALAVTIVLFWIANCFPSLAATPHFNFQYIPKPSALTSGQWAGNATLTETWRSHIGGGVESEYLSPSWTLCYEEQFYVVCGLLILFMPRRFFSGALGVSILTAGTFALSVALPSFHILGFFFDGKWLMFASGVMVYYVLNYCAASARVISGVLLALGIVVARMLSKYLVAHGITDKLVDDPYSWWTAFAFALAILVLRPFDGWICGNRLFTPIAFCGRMCYSLYLIHWPVCKIVGNLLLIAGVRGDLLVLLVTMPVVTAVSILAGWIFHQLVERHFLNPPAVLAPPFPRRQAFSEPELSVAI